MSVLFTAEAENNIKIARQFYQMQNPFLGKYFLTSVLNDVTSLKKYYGIHLQVNNYYKMLTSTFPFAVYYKVKSNNIIVYAVLDCRQKPINKFN